MCVLEAEKKGRVRIHVNSAFCLLRNGLRDGAFPEQPNICSLKRAFGVGERPLCRGADKLSAIAHQELQPGVSLLVAPCVQFIEDNFGNVISTNPIALCRATAAVSNHRRGVGGLGKHANGAYANLRV